MNFFRRLSTSSKRRQSDTGAHCTQTQSNEFGKYMFCYSFLHFSPQAAHGCTGEKSASSLTLSNIKGFLQETRVNSYRFNNILNLHCSIL
jgi:hypothetical protein